MKNIKNEVLEIIERKNRPIKRWSMFLALVLLVASTLLPSLLGTQLALADSDGERGHSFDITFTKWITTRPNMAGVVGGEVGTGTFAGEILNRVPGPVITNIEAFYHINGSIHSFTAHVFVTQDEVKRTAVIEGMVTDGWLKGWQVQGEYNIISCPDKTSGVCFQGILHIHVGSEG
jgi:hypothetical protein